MDSEAIFKQIQSYYEGRKVAKILDIRSDFFFLYNGSSDGVLFFVFFPTGSFFPRGLRGRNFILVVHSCSFTAEKHQKPSLHDLSSAKTFDGDSLGLFNTAQLRNYLTDESVETRGNVGSRDETGW